ncbi:MAG: hypothetical protein OXI74_05750 [Rhodospirillaceae bacterium]|nr:hypothetical protein [Rhodospirillaceae bacterium]
MPDFNANLAAVNRSIFRQPDPDDAVERAEIILDRVLWGDPEADSAMRAIIASREEGASDLLRFIVTFNKRHAAACISAAGPDAPIPPDDMPAAQAKELPDHRQRLIAISAAAITGIQSLAIAMSQIPELTQAATRHAAAIDFSPILPDATAPLAVPEAETRIEHFLDVQHPRSHLPERDRERHCWTASIGAEDWNGIALDAAFQSARD